MHRKKEYLLRSDKYCSKFKFRAVGVRGSNLGYGCRSELCMLWGVQSAASRRARTGDLTVVDCVTQGEDHLP